MSIKRKRVERRTASERPPIKERRPCLHCRRRTVTASQVCAICEPPPSTAKVPERQCKECPKITTSQSGYCRDCQKRQAELDKPKAPHPRHALKGGDWVVVRGIKRWEPAGRKAA